MPAKMEWNYIATAADGLVHKHFVPFQIRHYPFFPLARTQSRRKYDHRRVARKGLVYGVFGLARLAPVLVDRNKNAFERFYSHEEIVDKKLDPFAVAARQHVDEHHSVEATKRMVAHEYGPPVGRQIAGAGDLVGDLQMVKDAAAEIGVFQSVVDFEHLVELILADHTLEKTYEPTRNVAVMTRQTLAYHRSDIYSYYVVSCRWHIFFDYGCKDTHNFSLSEIISIFAYRHLLKNNV